MSTGIKKLQEEYKEIRKNGLLATIGGTCCPYKKDFLHWFGCITGPKNTPYSDGIYYFEIKFKNEYPNEGPIDVQMRTPIYHPNISSSNGHICETYFSDWKNTNDIVGIVNTIFDLLDDPNPDSSYHGTNNEKARKLKNKYAHPEQAFDWDNCWGKGWSLDDEE
jgi:ubiquitin-protein ligase